MKTLAEMQEEFKCNKCGVCCLIGGDMQLTEEDVQKIEKIGFFAMGTERTEWLTIDTIRSDRYRLKHIKPCIFQDKIGTFCIIHQCKPRACKDYPFTLFEHGECDFEAVIICPEARRILEKTLKEG